MYCTCQQLQFYGCYCLIGWERFPAYDVVASDMGFRESLSLQYDLCHITSDMERTICLNLFLISH